MKRSSITVVLRDFRRFCAQALALAVCGVVFSCAPSAGDGAEAFERPLELSVTLPDDNGDEPFLDLNGDWTATNERTGETRTLSTPANWFLCGIDSGGVWVYERSFTLVDEPPDDALVRLVFEGVDYETEVWLNGVFLGKRVVGYFQPFSFVVSSLLKFGGEPNTLRVRVCSEPERPEDWSLRKRQIKGIFGHHDTRPGGAWSERGQEGNTGGIWGRVFLQAETAVSAESVQIRAVPPANPASADEPAVAYVAVALRAEKTRRVSVQYAIEECGSFASPQRYESARREYVVHAGQTVVYDTLHIRNPRLWEPVGMGEPFLYNLVTLVARKYGGARGEEICSERRDKFGIRTARYDAHTGEWLVNGKRVFLRGVNYIGGQYLSAMSRESYLRDALLMTAANVNAVRVHAHIARKEWYDLCDSLGILVWQDFPLQWGYADDADFVREAARQTRVMIDVLGNHPSVIVWCLQNEPPFDADWMQYKYQNYQPLQNAALNRILTRVARFADPSRYVHPYSATSEHRWEGWYVGAWTDYARPTREKLITEFGAQALPALPTLKAILGDTLRLPTTPQEWKRWEYHNFQPHETFTFAKVPTGRSVEEFIRNTQAHQARVVELAAESYRLQRYKPVGAIFQFMFVEAWASMNWGIVDFQRLPKPAYYALAEAYQPTLIACKLDTPAARLDIIVVNDRKQAFADARLIGSLEREGSVVAVFDRAASVPADELALVHSLRLDEEQTPRGAYRFNAVLLNAKGDTLSIRRKRIDVRNDEDFYPSLKP
jgi:beta-mannosidase